MDLALLLVLQVVSWPPVAALFTVEAERPSYEAEYRDDVTMSCRFKPVPSSRSSGGSPISDLAVYWHRVQPAPPLEVYRWEHGVEKLAAQSKRYQGRVRLLTEDLERGWAKLQVSQLRINDSGIYRCRLEMGGADYKQITLSVKAPYENVTKSIQKSTEGDEVELTCSSQGFPISLVTWRNGDQQEIHSNSTTVTTPDQLYQVTSQIRVRASHKNNYTCSYGDGGPSARFDIPDEIPEVPVILERNDAVIISLSIMVLVVAIIAVVVYRRRKGSRGERAPSTRNPLVDPERDPAASAAYCESSSSTPSPPESSFFRRDPPGSGKTTIAQNLASPWARVSTHTPF